MVFAIEPMVNIGSEDVVRMMGDEWTAVTADGSNSPPISNTRCSITENGPEILTQVLRFPLVTESGSE